jgi:MFS transporter, OFA family, oxalate/formate antiporter
MKKTISIIASFCIMLCLGGVYAWSIFVPMLKSQLGFSTLQTQLIVGLTLGVFAISMLATGKIEQKIGPKITSMIGGLLLFAGYEFASLSSGNFLLICLSIGLLCGLGTGCCYVCCLVTPAKNYPAHKGLVTGISVAGFGAAAIILSNYVKWQLEVTPDILILDVFRILGFCYGILILISSLGLNYERKQINVSKEASKPVLNIKDNKFWILFFTMFAGTFSGLLIFGNAKPIVKSFGFEDRVAGFAITLLALGNMFGRVIWGWLMDKLGINKILFIAYSLLLIATVALNFMVGNTVLLYIVLAIIGLGFSSNFVLFAAKTTQIYGVEKLGMVYPYIFCAYGLAGIMGPLVGGWLFDLNQNYTYAIIISGVITLFAIILYQRIVSMEKSNV